jgi:Rrf2 family protein
MIDLAKNYKKGPLILKQVAKKERVSKKYLEQIVIKLLKANLVKSIRGAKGGYVLNKPPDKINVLDIYNILEEKSLVVACVKNRAVCPLVYECTVRKYYVSLQQKIEKILARQNLKNLTRN